MWPHVVDILVYSDGCGAVNGSRETLRREETHSAELCDILGLFFLTVFSKLVKFTKMSAAITSFWLLQRS